MGESGLMGAKGVPDLPPSSVIHHWIQFFELNILIPYLTTSGQLPTGAADPTL